MTIERMVELLKIELECVQRNNQPVGLNCDRDCGRCDLVQNPDELINMYDFVIKLLQIDVEVEK